MQSFDLICQSLESLHAQTERDFTLKKRKFLTGSNDSDSALTGKIDLPSHALKFRSHLTDRRQTVFKSFKSWSKWFSFPISMNMRAIKLPARLQISEMSISRVRVRLKCRIAAFSRISTTVSLISTAVSLISSLVSPISTRNIRILHSRLLRALRLAHVR